MYSCAIQILINEKSREDVHSGQRSRGFRVGHCHVRNTIRKKKDLYSLRLTATLLT